LAFLGVSKAVAKKVGGSTIAKRPQYHLDCCDLNLWCPKTTDKILHVSIVVNDISSFNAPDNDMMQGSWGIQPGSSWHGSVSVNLIFSCL